MPHVQGEIDDAKGQPEIGNRVVATVVVVVEGVDLK